MQQTQHDKQRKRNAVATATATINAIDDGETEKTKKENTKLKNPSK